ncbi:MAG: acetate--CoA ligase [Dehalococcoidia bacterium]|jgi:acetyl-CoA synthetase
MTGAIDQESKYWPRKRYLEVYDRSIREMEDFWAEEARKLDWFRTWDKVLEWDVPFSRWFVGGELNASYICVDRHIKNGKRNKVAIYWEGEPGDTRVLSYATLYREVNRCASVLKNLGVVKGDKVALYLPMIPELPIFMLACSRIGAIFTAVFSGFTAQAIADRMNDLEVKVLITADAGYRRGSPVQLKRIADEAMDLSPAVKKQVVVNRAGLDVAMKAGRDFWYHELLAEASDYVEPEPVEASHPLYVLYTSGTTGKPKGVVHCTGGYMVYTHSTFKWVFNPKEDSVYWCTADIGWVTGHSYIVYAPLAYGITSVMYEGAPNYPDLGRWWNIIQTYGINILYTSPTAIRMFMQAGEGSLAKYDLSSLDLLGTVGEPINPEAWLWYFKHVGGERCPIVDTWWQTETGGILISQAPAIELPPLKPGSASLPLPGIEPQVVNEKGEPVAAGERGLLVIKKPWPGMLMTLYGDPERYKEVYWDRFPGNYLTGDYSIQDDDGYFWLLGRADEVIKVAGHRLGTLELENAAVAFPPVAEAAAVSKPDSVKGEAIVIFVILRDGHQASPELRKELVAHIRNTVGPIATPESVFFVNKLPKTRSGKIMRRLLKAVATDVAIGDVTTLEDGASIEEVKAAYEELKKEL